MNPAELDQTQMIAAAAVGAFVIGALFAHFLRGSGAKSSRQEDPRNHRIRSLEADLRSNARQMQDLDEALTDKTREFNTAVETLQGLRAKLAERDAKVEELTKDLQSSLAKIRDLRHELQDRATERVREHVRAEEAQIELEVARAGSEAVLSEITRLQAEQRHLTDTVRNMGARYSYDDALFSDDEPLFDSK